MTRKKNRNPCRQFLVTFPKSTLTRLEFAAVLCKLGILYYKVVQESHQDGTPHLHAVIKTKEKITYSQLCKKFQEHLPDDYKRIDVDPVRSIPHCHVYLAKEDQSPVESGPYQETRDPSGARLNKLAKDFGYKSLEDFQRSYSEMKTAAGYVALTPEQMSQISDVRHFHKVHDSDPPFEIRDLLEKLEYSRWILKDDMTYLFDYYNFRL